MEIEIEDSNDNTNPLNRADYSSNNLNVSKNKYMDINMQNNAY